MYVLIVVLVYHIGLECMDDWIGQSLKTFFIQKDLVFHMVLIQLCKLASVAHNCREDLTIFFFFSPCCCLLVTCTELPYVPHAYLSEETERAQYLEGHVIHFSCEMGYISGPTIRYVCTNGGWVDIHKGPCYCEWQDSLSYSLFFGGLGSQMLIWKLHLIIFSKCPLSFMTYWEALSGWAFVLVECIPPPRSNTPV